MNYPSSTTFTCWGSRLKWKYLHNFSSSILNAICQVFSFSCSEATGRLNLLNQVWRSFKTCLFYNIFKLREYSLQDLWQKRQNCDPSMTSHHWNVNLSWIHSQYLCLQEENIVGHTACINTIPAYTIKISLVESALFNPL